MSIPSEMTRSIISTTEGKLEVYFKGKQDNPLIIFLHGFPEYWKIWIQQIEYFESQGYFVCAPNQRGYGHSFAPSSRRFYTLERLSKDIIGIIDQLPHDKAIIVGHDWGGGVVYHLATKYSTYFSHAIILNMPHPYVGRTYIFKKFEQMKKSFYVTLYQFPFVTSWLLRRNRFHHLTDAIDKSIKGNEELRKQIKYELVDVWSSRPAILKGMINWYRANIFYNTKVKIDVPTLLLWGNEEEFILKELAEVSFEYLNHEKSRIEFIPDSIHSSHLEQPEIVNSMISEFISD